MLIIGILSAVALPQYQKTVLKSRTAEAWSNLATIRTAVNAYCLEAGPGEGGFWSNFKGSMPIEVPDTENFTYGVFLACGGTSFTSNNPYSDVYAEYSKGGKEFKLSLNYYGQRICRGGAVCKELGFKNTATGQTCVTCGGSKTCYYMD